VNGHATFAGLIRDYVQAFARSFGRDAIAHLQQAKVSASYWAVTNLHNGMLSLTFYIRSQLP
jgi:hypothetical protein